MLKKTAMLLFGLFLFVSAALALVGYGNLFMGRQVGWRSATATVQKVDIQDNISRGSQKLFHILISVSYVSDSGSGSAMIQFPWANPSRAYVEKVAAAYPAGRQVPVFISRSDSYDATLADSDEGRRMVQGTAKYLFVKLLFMALGCGLIAGAMPFSFSISLPGRRLQFNLDRRKFRRPFLFLLAPPLFLTLLSLIPGFGIIAYLPITAYFLPVMAFHPFWKGGSFYRGEPLPGPNLSGLGYMVLYYVVVATIIGAARCFSLRREPILA